MYRLNVVSWVGVLSVVALSAIGCRSGGSNAPLDPGFNNTGGDSGASARDRNSDFERTNIDGLNPNLDTENLLFNPAEDMETVFFAYNSFDLQSSARAALERNADKMKQERGQIFQIEGHCDERGTQEYNLALGEKRALATREYLIQLGVSGDRLITISYGEELPAAMGTGESVWSKNRRCQFNRAM